MEILFGLFFFIFGTLIGSFLNVVILRYNTGSLLSGRSGCFSCGKTLKWYELFPLFSYLFLGGKCKKCKSMISWQYPLVELSTGFLFLGTYLKGYTDFSAIVPLSILSLLIVIFVYDIHHKIIPNGIVYGFVGISFAQLFVNLNTLSFVVPTTLDILAGPIFFIPFFAIWFFSKGMWMGLGDGKLVLGIGWMLGLVDGLSAVVLAFWIGAGISVLLLFLQRSLSHLYPFSKWKMLTIKSEIPFAPFLIIGFLLVFFFDINILLLTF